MAPVDRLTRLLRMAAGDAIARRADWIFWLHVAPEYIIYPHDLLAAQLMRGLTHD